MQRLIATRSLKYGTRRMLPGDEFDAKPAHARLLIGIKKARDAGNREPGRIAPPPAALAKKVAKTDIAAAREEYQKKIGRRPYHGWDVDELRRRMAEAETSAENDVE